MSESEAKQNPTSPQSETEPEFQLNEENAWVEQYFSMSREELLNTIDPVTLNQIRNTMGDQHFIDQWKMSEADYNNIIGGPSGAQNHQEPIVAGENIQHQEAIPHQQIQAQPQHH